jgi:hypothetical protein
MSTYLKGCLFSLILLGQIGCPGTGTPAQSQCNRVGQQCKRGQGELGVCTPTTPQSHLKSSLESGSELGQSRILECVAQH